VNQLQYTSIVDELSQTAEQALMVHAVEEFRKIDINRDCVSFCEIPFGFGNGGLRPATAAKTMTAVVERRFKDRLQNLERRLLNDAVDDIGNS
jgi:hypothetical protein